MSGRKVLFYLKFPGFLRNKTKKPPLQTRRDGSDRGTTLIPASVKTAPVPAGLRLFTAQALILYVTCTGRRRLIDAAKEQLSFSCAAPVGISTPYLNRRGSQPAASSLWAENKGLLAPSLPFYILVYILSTALLFVKCRNELFKSFAPLSEQPAAPVFRLCLTGKCFPPSRRFAPGIPSP